MSSETARPGECVGGDKWAGQDAPVCLLCVQTTCRGLQKGNPIGDSGARALAMVSGARYQ